MTSLPRANPSRATLQSVNTYLMSSSSPSTPSTPPPTSSLNPSQTHSQPTTTPTNPTAGTPSLPSRIFASLHGRWHLTRRITSRLSAAPSGTFCGTATFLPRPHDPQAAEGAGAEYVYSEEGAFTTDGGLEFSARRGYVWRYDGRRDEVDVYFAKEEGERFFHRVQFEVGSGGEERVDGEEEGCGGKSIMARGEHWCEPDNYVVGYEFEAGEKGMRRFGVRYEVKGPQKDYTSQAWYTREGSE